MKMPDIDLSYLASPAALFASLARETPLTCTWTQDDEDSYWAAACCDHLFVFNDGGPVGTCSLIFNKDTTRFVCTALREMQFMEER